MWPAGFRKKTVVSASRVDWSRVLQVPTRWASEAGGWRWEKKGVDGPGSHCGSTWRLGAILALPSSQLRPSSYLQHTVKMPDIMHESLLPPAQIPLFSLYGTLGSVYVDLLSILHALTLPSGFEFYSLCLMYPSLLSSFWRSTQFFKTWLRCYLIYGCFPSHISPVPSHPQLLAGFCRSLPWHPVQ